MGLTIKNASGERPIVNLYGVIGDDYGGITAVQFRDELASIPTKQPIELHVDSEGGSFFQAVTMHGLLSQRKGQVDVVVDGLAASAASLVAMAGKTITMSKHAAMMIHEASGPSFGRATDHRKTADLLDSINSQIVSIYANRFQGSREDLATALDAETWFFADEAVTAGLADSVFDAPAMAAKADALAVFKYRNVPDAILNPHLDKRASMQAKLEAAIAG